MLDTSNENASLIFNMNKPKYVLLDDIFQSNSKHYIIYLDSIKLFESFRHKYTQNVCSALISEKLTHNVAAEFFNYIAHWRHYFNGLDIKTTFILLHGSNDSLIEELQPEWNSEYRNIEHLPSANKFIDFVVNKLISAIAPTIPRVFVIQTNNLPSGVKLCRATVPLILEQSGEVSEKASKLIVTNDLAMMQNIYKLNKVSILRGSSKSIRRIAKSTLFEFLSREYKAEIDGIPDDYLPTYYALIGDAGLKPIASNIKKALVLNRLKSLGVRSPDKVNDPDFIVNMFADKIKEADQELAKSTISERLDIFDVSNRIQHISDADIVAITSQVNTRHTSPDVTEQLMKECFSYNNKNFGDLINMRALF